MFHVLRKSTTRAAVGLCVSSAAYFSTPAAAAEIDAACSSVCTWSCGIQDEAACNEVGGSSCHAIGCSTSYYYCHNLLAPNLLTCGQET